MVRRLKEQVGYREGYCDAWISAVERMANLAGLGDQANGVYHALWHHWENELQPWRDHEGKPNDPPVCAEATVQGNGSEEIMK